MKYSTVLLVILFVASCASKIYPPKSWWIEAMTIDGIENKNKVYINSLPLLIVKNSDNNSIKELTVIESFDITLRKDWNKLKELKKTGDIIYPYSAPPLSGGFGYILVRDREVIFMFEEGVQ